MTVAEHRALRITRDEKNLQLRTAHASAALEAVIHLASPHQGWPVPPDAP